MKSDRAWLEKLYRKFGWSWGRCRQHHAFTIYKPTGEQLCVPVSKIEEYVRTELAKGGTA